MVNTRGGGDSPFLLQRTLDMAENLRHGIFPPRWMAHAAYDLGYPMFNHYAALPYYLSGGLTALDFNPIVAIQATQTLGFILAALTMALWASRIYKKRAAVLLSVAAYTFAPFHLVNVYVRGDSLSEFYAFIWYPLILWALGRLAERPTRHRILTAALAYGGLILTHNVSAMIFSPFALLYAIVRMANGEWRMVNQRIKNQKSKIKNLFAPFLLGFLLTAWFWMPAIFETQYGQMGDEFTAGYFHYSQHFRGLNLVQPSWLFNYDIAIHTTDAGPFAMGLVQALLTIAGVVVLVKSRKSQVASQKSKIKSQELEIDNHLPFTILSPLSFILFSLALATLMLTPLSKALWDHLPLLEMTQFPWRFLSVQALFTAIVTGALGNYELQINESANQHPLSGIRYPVSAILLLLLIILPPMFSLHPDRLLIDADDVTWENLLLYETFTGNIGTTIRYEYLPQDVNPRLYISESVIDGQGRPSAEGNADLQATLQTRTPKRQEWRIALNNAAPVTFPLNWWPGWTAILDGTPVESRPAPGSGRLTLDIPAGAHTLTLRLRNTPLRTWAEVISGVTLIAWLVESQKSKVRSQKSKAERRKSKGESRKPKVESRKPKHLVFSLLPSSFFLLPFLLLLSLLPPLALQRSVPPATFFDFHNMPFPHAGPVNFDSAQLETALVSASTAQPGDTLTITHTWTLKATVPATGTLRLVSPAEPRHNIPLMLAVADFTLVSTHALQCHTTALTLPDDLSRGLYLLELRLADQSRPSLYIGALRVPHGPTLPDAAPVLATFRDLTLHTVTSSQRDATALRVKMAWSISATPPRNWSLSLRLLDIAGRQIVQQDPETHGYGYLPTTLWRPGELVTDHVVLLLPEGLAPGDYTLRIITYLRATGESGGEVDIPIRLDTPTRYDLRDACCEQAHKGATILCENDGVALLGLNTPITFTEGQSLDIHAEWNAITAPTYDLTATWALLNPAGDSRATTVGPLAIGSRTSEWPRHTWVRAPVHLDLPASLDAGDYTLHLTLSGAGLPDEQCALARTLTSIPRPRVFDIPALPHPQSATFGDSASSDSLRLLGYDLAHIDDTLTLTLWWQADSDPTCDYKRFVHIYDPATERLVAQDDAMPRAWTYPTTLWLAGEIVSETLTLDLSAAPPGNYHIAVGWYAPETVIRLPARDAEGGRLPHDRVVLDGVVEPGQ